MQIVYKVSAYIPKSLVFSLDEVTLMLRLLKMKKQYSTDRELETVNPLIEGFESLKSDLEDEERAKAGL